MNREEFLLNVKETFQKTESGFGNLTNREAKIISIASNIFAEQIKNNGALGGVSESTSLNAPEKIYLNIGFNKDMLDIKDIDFEDLIGVTWSKDKLSDNDIMYSR